MKKILLQALALMIAVILASGAEGVTSLAQEIEGHDSKTADSTESTEAEKSEEGAVVKISGTKATLDCAGTIQDMSWDFFSQNESSINWSGRMNLSDYAADLYFTLIEGANNDGEQDILIDDSAFAEETAVKVNYSNGKQDIFNGIEVMSIRTAVKMAEEEWTGIQENIRDAYNAFRMDYPGVFWIGDAPKVSRVCTVRADDEGKESYEYHIYFLLKNHSRSYDIRNKDYQSEEAIKEGIERRDQGIQEIFKGVEEKTPAEMVLYFNKKLDILIHGIGLDDVHSACALKMLCDYAGVPCVLAAGLGGIFDGYVRVDDTWYMSADVQAALQKSEAGGEESKGGDTEKENAGTDNVRPALRSAKMTVFGEIARNVMAGSLRKNAYLEKKVIEGEEEAYQRIDEPEEFFSVNKEPYYYSAWGEVIPLAAVDYTDIYIFVEDSNNPDGGNRYKADKDSFGLLGVAADTRITDDAQSRCAYTIIYNLRDDTAGADIGSYNIFSDSVTIKPRLLKVERGNLELAFEYGDQTGATAVVRGETHLDFAGIVTDDFQIDTAQDVEVFPISIEWDKKTVGQMAVRLKEGAIPNYTIMEEGESFAVIEGIPFTVVPRSVEDLSDITVTVEGGPYIYDGLEKRPKVTVAVGGDVLEEDVDYEIDYKGSNLNAGKAAVCITSLPDSEKYIWEGERTEEFEIKQAVWPKCTDRVFVRYGKSGEYNLANDCLAFDGKLDEADISVENSEVFRELPVVKESSILEYKIKDDEELAGSSAKITIPVKDSANFEIYDIELTVNITAKTPQKEFRFEYEVLKKPVREKAYKIPAVGAAEGSTVTYESSDTDVATVDENGNVTALTPGKTTITANASETTDYMEGEAHYQLIVVEGGRKVDILNLPAEGEQEYCLEIEEGVSDIDVPDSLQKDAGLGLDTGAKIEERLKAEVKAAEASIQDENIAVYDITLMVKRDGSWDWEVADDTEFLTNKNLQDGFSAVIPYPVKAKKGAHDFTAVCMFTKAVNGRIPGDVEIPEVVKTDEGLQFESADLSLIAVGWEE